MGTLPRYPFPSASLTDPPADYAPRRAACPLGRVRLPSDWEAVLLVTYRDVAAVVADPRLSYDLTGPVAPRTAAGPRIQDDSDVIFNMDGKRHRRLWRLAASPGPAQLADAAAGNKAELTRAALLGRGHKVVTSR